MTKKAKKDEQTNFEPTGGIDISEKDFEKLMTPPEPCQWSDADVLAEYKEKKDAKKVAKIFCIPLRDVNAILRREGKI